MVRSFSKVGSDPTRWYQTWIAEKEPTEAQLAEQRRAAQGMAQVPLVSILAPVHNPVPEALDRTIQSVVDQTCGRWELCLADGHSTRPGVRRVLQEWANRDERIHVKFLDRNLGISGNSNEALAMARGEFVALLDHDDLLAPFALFEVARFLRADPECDMVYSDEDKIDPDGRRHTPFFKPDWSPDLLQSFMYTGHLSTYRRELLQSLDGFRSEFDYSQDYDLALRVTEATDRIGHIPKVLYHWLAVPGSASSGGKPFARASNIAALASAARRRGYSAEVVAYPTVNRVRFRLEDHPLVSIIIATDRAESILPGLVSLLQRTNYASLEVLVVTSTDLADRIDEVHAADARVRTMRVDAPINFSARCNRGVEESHGQYLLFLDEDVEPLDEEWIECLLGYFQQDGVGAVSPKLLYPNGLVQHAGLVTGVRGFVGTAFHAERSNSTVHFNFLQSTRTVSALSAACLLMPRRVFESIGGFDEVHTPIMHRDAELCFRIREAGLRLVYTPFTSLQHTGHAWPAEAEGSGSDHSDKADVYLLQRWGKHLSYDPYYPDNMRDLLYRDSPVSYRVYADNCADGVFSHSDLLFVSHDLGLSGAAIVLHALARSLHRVGYSVTFASSLGGELVDSCQQDRIPVIVDPLIYDSPSDLERFLRNYDVIVASSILSWPLVNTAKSLGRPVIWFIHEGEAGRRLAESEAGVQKALAVADSVVYPSHRTREMYCRFPVQGNQMVLHYGIDGPDSPGDRAASPGSGRLRVVHLGSVERRQGQDVLLKCTSSLPPELLDAFEFGFVSRPLIQDYRGGVRRETARPENVTRAGQLSHSEVLQLVSDADVVVCTSWDDSWPLVLLEAMAHGKAIVSTNAGALPELIEHEASGLIVDVEDHDALAEALARLYHDRGLLLRLGEAARRTYKGQFTLDRYVHEVAEIIQRIAPPRGLSASLPSADILPGLHLATDDVSPGCGKRGGIGEEATTYQR